MHSTKTSTLANFVIYGRRSSRNATIDTFAWYAVVECSTRRVRFVIENGKLDSTNESDIHKKVAEECGSPQAGSSSWRRGETCLVRHQIYRSSWSTRAGIVCFSQHFSYSNMNHRA
uniref:Uncharacterized protein n=1 Tax=Haemonchus contortus TaxID=6289 RepID=A0A7I4YP10_HAECO